MITTIQNQDFGIAVACDTVWAAVGNPNPFRYNAATSSLVRTGSVDVYRYNINTDTHDLKAVLFRPLTVSESIDLTTELTNSAFLFIQTEPTGVVPLTANDLILVDAAQYYTASEDGYGWAVDLRNTILAVGNPYFTSTFTFPTTSFVFSSSGYVDIFDLSRLDINTFIARTEPTILSSSLVGGFYSFQVSVIANQNFSFVLLQSLDTTNPLADWVSINVASITNAGGTIVIPTSYASITNLNFRVLGIISTNPFVTSIKNPNPSTTGSFGYEISMNDEWLAIASPFESSSKGAVFMFQNSGNNASWSYIQTLPYPAGIGPGDKFGYAIGMNKATSSYSRSMVVGSLKPSSSRAYLYEYNTGSGWVNTYTFVPDNTTIYPLTFYPSLPLTSGVFPNTSDAFGQDVAMYKDSVIIGAPTDRDIYEFSGSQVYQQGAVYFFERCGQGISRFYMADKSYGNEKTIKNNLLGWSVSIFDQYAIAGCPKINSLSQSVCFLRGSIFQGQFCDDTSDATLNGQFILYNKTSGSGTIIPDTTGVDWDITNVYQTKKRFLSPYRVYGWDCHLCSQFVVIGAPMLISGSNVVMDFTSATGSFTGSLSDLGDLSGKAYIYNLKNLREQFYVGNVFYRNGKMVIMTSGSSFAGLQLSNTVNSEYEYEMSFKSKQVVYEKQVVCPVDIGEFNVSTNPTAIVLPDAEFDVNNNGTFDFQDADVLLRYMKYKSTVASGIPLTDWSSSILDTTNDEESTVYNMFASMWEGTDSLFSASFTNIDTTMFTDLDLNNDNKIDSNDMNILWKYFIYRLTQKNYETYITPNSQLKFLSDIIDFLNTKSMRGQAPSINTNFLNYAKQTKADPTGSYLAPYATSIGLYDGTDLVAIAKLGSPIKITPDFPINFVVKIDF